MRFGSSENAENGTGSLVKAIAALEAGLSELTRERDPLGWGDMQSIWANALQRLWAGSRRTSKNLHAGDSPPMRRRSPN